MPMPLRAGANQTELPPSGSRPAVLVGIIDLGTHTEEFEGKKEGDPKRYADIRKVFLVWELTADPNAGYKRNHVIAKEYTFSLSPKAGLRKMLEAWRGKAFGTDEEFDLEKTLGASCLLTISHHESNAGNTYAKLDGVTPIPMEKGKPLVAVPKPGLKPFAWSIDSEAVPDEPWIPWTFYRRERVPVEKVIQASHEWLKRNGQRPAPAAPQGEDEWAPEDEPVAPGGGKVPF